MGRKLTSDEAKEKIKNNGFELLEEYKNKKKQKLKFRCHCGKEFYSTLYSVLKSKSCGCSRKNRIVKKQDIYDKIINLHNNNLNKKQISIKLKINLSTINWCYKKFNIKTKDYHGENHPNWTGYKEICGKHFARIKTGAIKRKIEFNINIKQIWELYLKQDKKCAISGLPIYFIINGTGSTASLDRIDSSKGYIEGNLQWVHKDINRMKQEFSQEYFINICNIIANFNNKGV